MLINENFLGLDDKIIKMIVPKMQEISCSDVKLGKECEDMRTALGWMNVDWYTFCVLGKS